jgi:uncharacterized protein
MRVFRCALAYLCFAPILALAQSSVHSRILISGTPVGENTYVKNADGSFTSKSSLELGTTKLTSSATGHFKDGKLVDSIADTDGPNKAKVVFAKGKVTVTVGGKTGGGPWSDKTGSVGGNLHPQFYATTLLIAEKSILASPANKSVTVPTFVIDGGMVLPVKVTMLQPKQVVVNGKTVSARHFTIELAGISAEMFLGEDNTLVAEEVASQHIRFIEDGWDAVFVDPMAKFPELSQSTYKTRTDKGVHVRMRDNVELICDVVRPDDNEKHPAILVRTPYGRGSETAGGMFYATRGYAYVSEDCRGREDSYGSWDPFMNEGPDGYDTIEWVAKQPWSDGKVGMIGGSYAGSVQWSAAVLNPPALKCIVPEVSPPDAMRNMPYDHGIFMLYGGLWWSKIVAGRRTDFSTIKGDLPHPDKFATLPLSKVDDAVLGENLEFFDSWLARPTIGDWKGWDYTYHLADSHVPALHISGIWDGDEIGTHLQWAGMRELNRKDQWIVFGPWVHAFNTNNSFGGVEYGPDAIIDLDSVTLRWFDTWLKGKDVGLDKVPHVKLFVTGANKWITLPDWPAPSTPPKTLYFAKDSLSDAVGKADERMYTYDPAKDANYARVRADQDAGSTKIGRSITDSGLFLKTAAFEKDTAIAAPFKVKLYFKSSAVDTDFFAMIVDVAPNGEARLLGQPGKIRASYLSGMDAVRPLTPGQEYMAEIEPWDFAHEFKKGHRMGVVIVSSMFPAYARNLGTAEPILTATKMVVQKNTILMGEGHPSSISFYTLWEK